MGIALYILFSLRKRTKDNFRKMQAAIFLNTAIISLSLASLTDVILPRLNIYTIPNIAPSFVLIWAFGLVYAIARYKLLSITPVTAAENIISVMADALLLLDQKDTIVFMNNSTSTLLEYGQKELYGQKIDILFPDNLKRTQLDKIAQKDKVGNYDFVLKTKSGKNIPVIFTSSAMRGTLEELVGTVCIVKDITRHKKADEALRKAYDDLKETQGQLIQLEKMSSIGQLASGAAHEINNPLTVISGEAQMLSMNKNKETKNSSKIIVEQSERIREIIGRLLEFSHKKEFELVPLDINTIVKKTISLLSYQAKIENMEIEEELDPNIPKVPGDSHRLQEVFLNIMLNAIQAMEGKGKLTIRTYKKKVVKYTRRKTDTFKGPQGVVVEFKDTGKGMNEETLTKIFDPFFSTKEKNTGLGLSICYGIIKNHNGLIEVQSKVGKGTTFTIKLPIYKEEK
jgi:PAS domain S-box-containing protein